MLGVAVTPGIEDYDGGRGRGDGLPRRQVGWSDVDLPVHGLIVREGFMGFMLELFQLGGISESGRRVSSGMVMARCSK